VFKNTSFKLFIGLCYNLSHLTCTYCSTTFTDSKRKPTLNAIAKQYNINR
jgi:hypothetical protein